MRNSCSTGLINAFPAEFIGSEEVFAAKAKGLASPNPTTAYHPRNTETSDEQGAAGLGNGSEGPDHEAVLPVARVV